MAEAEPLEENCDPICRLQECLADEFKDYGWQKDIDCGGSVSVDFTVIGAKPDDRKAKLRGHRFVNLTIIASISVDSCRAGSCTAGLVHQQVCDLLESKKLCNGCISVEWLNTDRRVDEHGNDEFREATFVATLVQRKKSKNNNNKEITNGVQLRQ